MTSKTLIYEENEYTADNIVKGKDYIKGYLKGEEVFSFGGISDFSLFSLENGESYDSEPKTTVETFDILKASDSELSNTLDMILTEIIPGLMGGDL